MQAGSHGRPFPQFVRTRVVLNRTLTVNLHDLWPGPRADASESRKDARLDVSDDSQLPRPVDSRGRSREPRVGYHALHHHAKHAGPDPPPGRVERRTAPSRMWR
jgi:hypothetical protein